VYDLEEAIDEMRARESELGNELQRLDEDKLHLEDVIAALKEARRKMQDERDEFAIKHQRAEDAHKEDRETWDGERAAEAEQHRRQLAGRDQVTERLTAELEASRERVAMKDADLVSVQNLLRSVEDQHRKLGDERSSDQRSLELEIDRLKRDLAQYEDELERARDELQQREQALHARDMEVADLMDKQRDNEAKLATERQGRLTLSDKLDAMTKTSRQFEREATQLKDRLSSTEPRINEMQNSRSVAVRDAERQKQERTELLVRVLKDLNRFLGVDERERNVSPINFTAFREAIVQRLRSINTARADLDKRVKEAEGRMEHKLLSLKRQLDTKWRVLDSFESSVKKLESQKAGWRAKLSLKESELDAAKARTAELNRDLALARAGEASASAGDISATTLRQLTERAQAAERRAASATNAVKELEARLVDIQSRNARAEEKWEARTKEWENRFRQAQEKIKSEKQGGKERANQLEAQVR
jgi:chromosome segregation ATPase